MHAAAASRPLSRRSMLVWAGALASSGRAWAQPPRAQIAVGVEAALLVSGLAARLAAALARDTGLQIAWQPGPSGLLLPALERGELDAALTHEPHLEAVLLRQNLVHDRRPVAATEVVLVGPAPRRAGRAAPADDPAGVTNFAPHDAATALARIAAAGGRGEARFVASGEPSGTRALEQAAWQAAGPQPLGPWLRTAGDGAEATLALARETAAYAFVERGVWTARGANSGLAVLVDGDPRLVATYHVMRSFRVHHPGGKLLVSWLAGPRGRRTVAAFARGYRPAS